MQKSFLQSLFLLGSLFLVACAQQTIDGNGKPISISRTSEPFQAIDVRGDYKIIVKTGQPQQITLNTDENIEPYVETNVQNGVLTIRAKAKTSLKPSIVPTLVIATDSLNAISAHGSADINITGLATSSFTADLHGSGDIFLAGKTERLAVNINGSGKLNSEKLFANNVTLQIKGSSEAIVHAEQQLDIDLSGSGAIKYYGHPISLKQRIKGSGTITPLTPNP